MKRTSFYDIHKSLNAKIVEFGGFEMPVLYTGIIEEHLAVRNKVGVFDVSHMGEFEVSGPGALQFLQKVTINDVSVLIPGRVQYSAMCYEDGGIVDDLLVYNLGDKYMMVVNAANLQKDYDWLQSHLEGNVNLVDKSDGISLLAIQGPGSKALLQKLMDVNLDEIPYYHCKVDKVAGVEMLISRTGYTGELGYEIYFGAGTEMGKKIWDAVFEVGREFRVTPIGLGARDTLRLEAGYCLYGNDIDKTTNPLEAGLGWITKLNKGDFIGRNILIQAKQNGLKRHLIGFKFADKSIARHGYGLRANGKSIGIVTSGTFSPVLKCGIGMGYVETEFTKEGTTINAVIRNKEVTATVVKLPFIEKS
jgi:aminomethyltransferase